MTPEEAKNELEKMKMDLEIALPFIQISLKKPRKLSLKKTIQIPDVFLSHYTSIFDTFGSVLFSIKMESAFGSSLKNIHNEVTQVIEGYEKAYDVVLRLKQGLKILNKKESWQDLEFFYLDVLELLRKITIENSLKPFDIDSVKYSEKEVQIKIEQSNLERMKIRQKLYLRMDPKAQELKKSIIKTTNDVHLDNSLGKLFYLAGFDYEVYNKMIGNIDLIVTDPTKNHLIIIETTTGKVNKTKVAQIVSRKEEYSKAGKIFDKAIKLYTAIISNKTDFADELGLSDAKLNNVAVLGPKELENLLELLSKNQLDKTKVIEILESGKS